MLITLFHDGFKGQYFLWTSVIFSIGIILYFSLSFKPSGKLFKFVPLTALGLGLLLFVRQPNQKYRQIGLSLMIFSGGFLFAQFETFRADSPFLKYPTTCPFVFHRKMSKPGETLFYEFKTGNDMPVHYVDGLKK